MAGTLPGPPASLAARMAAALLDGAVLWVSGVLWGFTVLRLAGGSGRSAVALIAGEAILLAGWGAYFAWAEGRWGLSLGKLALGLQVVGWDGRPIGVRRALLRLAAKVAGLALFGLGWLPALASPERQAWYDRLAGSLVCASQAWPAREGAGRP
ncbi:MAG: RDD family protein [Symbiobacteriaceae bacterium]